MEDFVDILRCPTTHGRLSWAPDGRLISADGTSYAYRDGVASLLPEQSLSNDPSQSVRDFYQKAGWEEDQEGVFSDTKAFVDTRNASLEFTRECMRRLGRYFKGGGRYLLDAGSGPIPHDALLDYGNPFERRVCVDLSEGALRVARGKLGDRGIYLQGDLTNLPIADNSMDAALCYHVLYQVPADRQPDILNELWRVLKRGGVCVVVYWWPHAPLAWRVEQLAKLIGSRGEGVTSPQPELFHEPLPRSWFEAQPWPFDYQYDIFRLIDNGAMLRCIGDDWRGKLVLGGMSALQRLAPAFCGKYGRIPAIVFRKPA